MKTTLDIPNELYRQAKAVAALESIRMKDLITEGLRLALEERKQSKKRPDPLEMLREVRQNPLHTPGEVTDMMQQSDRLRPEGWNREDLP